MILLAIFLFFLPQFLLFLLLIFYLLFLFCYIIFPPLLRFAFIPCLVFSCKPLHSGLDVQVQVAREMLSILGVLGSAVKRSIDFKLVFTITEKAPTIKTLLYAKQALTLR